MPNFPLNINKALLKLILVLLFGYFNPWIVINNPLIREFLFPLAYFIMLLGFIISIYIESDDQRKTWLVRFGIGAFVGFIFLLISLFKISDLIERKGIDYAFQNIYEIQHEGIKYKVYRTDGGATVDFGIVVRKERYFFYGISIVSNIYSKYHMDTIGIELNTTNKVLRLSNPHNKYETILKIKVD